MSPINLWGRRVKKYLTQPLPATRYIHSIGGGKTPVVYADILFSALTWGATIEDYTAMEFYRKSWRERNGFVTAWRNFIWLYRRMYDERAKEVFDHKETFNRVFADFIKRDWLNTKERSESDIRNFISKHGTVIVKPTDSAEGNGIFKLSNENKEAVDRLISEVKAGAVYNIEQLIVQHSDMARLNPHSVNTVRIETIIDRKGDVHINNTVVIMGTNESVVNNTHSGGIMCHIDPESGIIDSHGRNPRGEKYFRHPASGLVLPGYQLPEWEELENFVRKLAKKVPSARYIGWDIVIQENGYEVIEGNTRPGHCTQACDGVGRWKRIKRYV